MGHLASIDRQHRCTAWMWNGATTVGPGCMSVVATRLTAPDLWGPRVERPWEQLLARCTKKSPGAATCQFADGSVY